MIIISVCNLIGNLNFIITMQCVQDYVSSENIPAKLLTTSAYKKNDGKLFGGQFQDGVTNAIDAMSMIR